jgi:hypothetical protein
MAGKPWNAIPIEEHLRRGTYRRDRHGAPDEAAAPVPVTAAERRRTLVGLGPEARRLAAALLDEYGPWDAASLATVRLWAQSGERLATLTDDIERRRETRGYLALLAALELPK